MLPDDRLPFEEALAEAREAAFAPGEFVGQESFVRASEVLDLARRAGVGPGVRVLDLCCGIAGPGRHVAAELGCTYLGVDGSPGAVAIARERAVGLDCRFEVGSVPPLPEGRFDVVLLLETLLAFRDKDPLLRAVAAALEPGGRFAFTLEEGVPLSEEERARMPDADTVWLTPWSSFVGLLGRVGLDVVWSTECTDLHLTTVESLTTSYEERAGVIAAGIGRQALEELVAGHRLWASWLRSGRARKLAGVAVRRD